MPGLEKIALDPDMIEVLSTAEQESKNCLAMAVVPIVAKSAVAAMALPKSLVREKGLPCCSAGESSGEPFLLPVYFLSTPVGPNTGNCRRKDHT